jgi:hypothetical protein
MIFMMRVAVLLAAFLCTFGCAQPGEEGDVASGGARSLSDLAHENQSNIAYLSVGMNKAEVLKIMGKKSGYTKDGLIANPFKSETFQDRAGVQYEVLYYVTERNRRFQPLRIGNTTPLVFKENVLIGWGSQTLYNVRAASR